MSPHIRQVPAIVAATTISTRLTCFGQPMVSNLQDNGPGSLRDYDRD